MQIRTNTFLAELTYNPINFQGNRNLFRTILSTLFAPLLNFMLAYAGIGWYIYCIFDT